LAKIENELVTEARAVPAPRGRAGYLAYFQCRMTGARYVRDANGCPIVYQAREQAERAAWRGLADAIDAKAQPRSAAAKVFGVIGSGKNKRAVPA
jgi:hypothetical protein